LIHANANSRDKALHTATSLRSRLASPLIARLNEGLQRVTRGVEPALAKQVAQQLMTHDALGAHARDELGISAIMSARPVQAALASAVAFAVGALLPLITVFLVPETVLATAVSATSLVFLALLGVLAAWAGGAPIIKSTVRVTFWGALAMALTALVGSFFGTTA
jgi:VIT1/CCC1 family predicted Fe2+/Mn2+ transporter